MNTAIQWHWVLDHRGVWHALTYPPTNLDPTGKGWEPGKGSMRPVVCINSNQWMTGQWVGKQTVKRITIHDYSFTNPIPSKCCQDCKAAIITKRVMEKMGLGERE